MAKTTLKKEELDALKAKAKIASSATDLSERFQKIGNRFVFKAMRKTPRSYAGVLDLDPASFKLSTRFEFREISLISPDDFDYVPKLSAADKKSAEPIDEELQAFKSYYAVDSGLLNPVSIVADALIANMPEVVDHRVNQSPVKDQGGRGTCVSHACMAVLEAFPHISDNLSEQYTHYKFNEFLNRPHNQDNGLKTTDGAPFLARSNGRVCLESQWPYISSQTTINNMVANNTYGPPQAAVNNQSFGIGSYKIIEDKGLVGESIKNTRYLEALLFQGYDIVFGCHASWDDKDNNDILDPFLKSDGSPANSGGHAMLIVGYNRNEQYFIVKNSWGATWGHNGYGYFHYNFIRACAKYGFVVHSTVPAAPPNPLPRKLALAPYNSSKISRAALRAAVVFFKTSSGRFAVAEAYAGDNLYLRNLRVYNPNGSLHLTRSALIIRSSYLCDLDTGRETSTNADFWWEGVRAGVHNLVPRNNAQACIGYNLAGLNHDNISTMNMSTTSVYSKLLNFAVFVGKTNAGRTFKMLVHAKSGNKLHISYLEVYNSDGSRYKYKESIDVPSSWTYNLDSLSLSGGNQADIWWNVISDNVAFLRRYSTAKLRLVWTL
ncbi:C1 family peptidase [Algoriphagus taiwanensis]|uniref:Peptidase C1A papain C-terminal domain-containing protein n=1 Tax=Algoriphagus taiwanensis TaxID=1445656 RepID=A0ABQ6PXP6_9BACT|nr:hypothetical protein Ataiwa_09710 [Algoriphagus taiwanensis]